MNREIKFRLWNNCGEHSKMFYKTDQVIECLKQQIEFNNNEPFLLGYDHEGDGSSFMQFTGLLDKNGVEIYEGDILFGQDKGESDRYKMSEAHVVRFKNGCFEYKGDPIGWDIDEVDEETGRSAPYNTNNWAYVQGNIYQNPELLETVKK